ncbi:MAG: hypothetical protein KAR38_17290, partial [Calditrichia bacterium]|nr:hypothetical protein [Calditrichia bacterium]
MTLFLTPWDILFLSAALQGIFLSLFILGNKRGKKKPNVFLGFLILIYSIDLGLEIIASTNYISEYPFLVGLNDPLLFLFGPLLYLYAAFLCSPQKKFSKFNAFHFLPAIIILVYYIPGLYLQSSEIKLSKEYIIEGSVFLIDHSIRDNVWSLSLIHELTYMVLSLSLINKYVTKIKDLFSSIENIQYNWLRNLIVLSVILTVLNIFLYIFVDSEILLFEQSIQIILLLSSAFIYTMGYMGLRQSFLFLKDEYVSPAIPEKNPKYSKSLLSSDKSE